MYFFPNMLGNYPDLQLTNAWGEPSPEMWMGLKVGCGQASPMGELSM